MRLRGVMRVLDDVALAGVFALALVLNILLSLGPHGSLAETDEG